MPLRDQKISKLTSCSLLFLLVAFFSLELLQILNHSLWQDEWQAWLIARDSRSLPELFHHLKYESHPALWYLALYGLSLVTVQPLAMQLFHLALATAAVHMVLRFAPFTRLQKIMFVFGYFPFFEYAVISRNYVLGMLLIFIACAVFAWDFARKPLVLAGLLFLLCQTSFYGVLAALALAAALIVGKITASRRQRPASTYEWSAAELIVLTGVALAVLQLKPPPDSGFAVDWRFDFDPPALVRTVGAIWESYVPLPSLQPHFWNTSLLSQPLLKFFLALLLLAWSLLFLRRRPAALALFGLGSLALLSFT